MSPLEILGFALGTSFASGLNLYATVAALGLLQRFGVIELPPQLHAFSHSWVLGLALFWLTGCGGGPFAPPIPDLTTTTTLAPEPGFGQGGLGQPFADTDGK